MFGPCYVLWFLVSPSLCLVLVVCCGSWCPLVCVLSLLCVVVLGAPSPCWVLVMRCGSWCPLVCVWSLLGVVVLSVP